MSATNTCPNTFFFLDGRGPAIHRKEIRSYLSRQGYRKRKAQEAHKQRSRLAPVLWETKTTGTGYCLEASPTLLEIQLIAEHNRKPEEHESLLPPLTGRWESDACSKHLQHQFAANSLVTAIERELIQFDPFTTLPVALDRSAEALAYLATGLFLQSTPHWISSKFTEAISLPLAFLHKSIFCAMLAATSGYIDSVSGHGPSVDTIIWAGASTSYVSQLISNPESRYGDDALVGILSVLNSEALLGNSENCIVHSRGLARLLIHRGGLWSLQGSHSIDMYVSFLLITPVGRSRIAYLDQIQSDADGIAEINDWMLDLDFLISTLLNLVQWSSPRPAKQADIANGLKELMQRLMTTRDEFDESQQFFVLLYLAFSSWEYRTDSESYFVFLRKLCQAVTSPSRLAEVTWILIQGLDDDRHRKWKVIRMAKVVHRLQKDTTSRMKQFLYQLVRSGFDDVEVVPLTGRELVQIRDEALAGFPVDMIET